jgi:ferredoxin
MLDAARRVAFQSGWPDASIHFEYFENATVVSDTSEFEVSLARSALTFRVRSGETILEALRANGVQAPSSCEQGACGTCLVRVIDGIPDHQDVYMSDSEHAANDRIATCISRALSERLILDI